MAKNSLADTLVIAQLSCKVYNSYMKPLINLKETYQVNAIGIFVAIMNRGCIIECTSITLIDVNTCVYVSCILLFVKTFITFAQIWTFLKIFTELELKG